MFGLDERIAASPDGASIWIVLAVAVLLGLRGFGSLLVSHPARAAFGGVAPALGGTSLAFGIWYATAAGSLAPYPL